MPPALTFTTRRIPSRRAIVAGLGASFLALSLSAALWGAMPSGGETAAAVKPLAQRLSPSTWALAVPTSWLGAPIADVRPGDSVDLLAVRTGDRPIAIAIAADLRVMSVDAGMVVFEVDEEGATAIATARASSLLLVPLLRSTK